MKCTRCNGSGKSSRLVRCLLCFQSKTPGMRIIMQDGMPTLITCKQCSGTSSVVERIKCPRCQGRGTI